MVATRYLAVVCLVVALLSPHLARALEPWPETQYSVLSLATFAHDWWGGTHFYDLSDRGMILGDRSTQPLLFTLPNVSLFACPGEAVTTLLGAINNMHRVVGTCSSDTAPQTQAFLYFPNRRGQQFQFFSAPTSTQTLGISLNDDGVIIGLYRTHPGGGGPATGFIRRNGRFRNIKVPGSLETVPQSINKHVQVVGYYTREGQPGFHGFLFHNGQYTPLDAPDAVSTLPFGMNDAGKVVGLAALNNGMTLPFLYDPATNLWYGITVSASHPEAVGLDVTEINNRDQMVGSILVPDPTDPPGGVLGRGLLIAAIPPEVAATAGVASVTQSLRAAPMAPARPQGPEIRISLEGCTDLAAGVYVPAKVALVTCR
jgi:hypothetical protein